MIFIVVVDNGFIFHKIISYVSYMELSLESYLMEKFIVNSKNEDINQS